MWWTGDNLRNEQSELKSTIIRLWDTLKAEEQTMLRISGMALFPELFSDLKTKYKRFTLWLTVIHNVVSPSLRDSFSAGGRVPIVLLNEYGDVPRIIANAHQLSNDISAFLYDVSEDILCETWGVDNILENRLEQWINLMPTTAAFNKKEFPV